MRSAALLFAGLALLLAGCDSADQNPFVVRVASINQGGPLLADVIAVDQDSVAYIPTELVEVQMVNRAYSSLVTDPGSYAFDFQLQRLTVHWRRADGGPTAGPGWNLADFDHTVGISAIVPFDDEATFGTLIVPVSMKTVEPFLSLRYGGSVVLTADIDFIGTPAINRDKEIHVPTSLSVSFANFADRK